MWNVVVEVNPGRVMTIVAVPAVVDVVYSKIPAVPGVPAVSAVIETALFPSVETLMSAVPVTSAFTTLTAPVVVTETTSPTAMSVKSTGRTVSPVAPKLGLMTIDLWWFHQSHWSM